MTRSSQKLPHKILLRLNSPKKNAIKGLSIKQMKYKAQLKARTFPRLLSRFKTVCYLVV